MISCPLCKKVFRSPCNLQDHMVTHTKEKPHKCHICSVAFGTKSDKSKHIKSVHEGEGIKRLQKKNSKCPLCSYQCCRKSDLRMHLRTHSGEQPFSCSNPGCGFKTKQEGNLKRHFRGVHLNERPYECLSDGCNYKAKCSTSFRIHLKTHCNERPFACQFPGCNSTFKFKNTLTKHTSTVHSDEKPFKCSTCGFCAKRKSYLKNHMRTHDKVKRFQCPNCGFASYYKVHLKQHFDRKHRQKNVLCTAPGCNFRCGAITVLKEHLKDCHENPILKCPRDLCNFRTRRQRNLLLHISLRHQGSTSGSVEKLQCQYPSCGYVTQSPHSYERHKITHNKKENRKYVCMFCFSRFTKFCLLQYHLQRHNGEKPHGCSHCNYASASIGALKTHARRVHRILVIPCGKEDQVRKCFTCSKIFWSNIELVLHSMSHLQPVVVLEKLKLEIM